MTIYLSSQSSRRRELLTRLGIAFEVLDISVPERWDGVESPRTYVKRLALEKARAGARAAADGVPVLGADTEVVIDGTVLGKPVDADAAMAMLRRLSGRTHEVNSAVALVDTREQVLLNTSRVTFAELSDRDCADYCDCGEPFGKAGGYAIQGRAAAFIVRLEGSYSGVMGLPLAETRRLLDTLLKT